MDLIRASFVTSLALTLGAAYAPALAATRPPCAMPSYASAPESYAVVVPTAGSRQVAGELLATSDAGRSWRRSALETAQGCPVDVAQGTGTRVVRCGGVVWYVRDFGARNGARGYVFARD
ncbi:MAG: hypothetical protein ACLPYS_06735 [Vulcanimicrobiaceae bacterium]